MAAPELRLNVTLDLAAFRGQLGKLAQEAGSRYFGVRLSIDETDFRKQLKNLEKIKPVITINDSQVIAARERIGTLNKSLATLRRATSTPIEIKIKYVEVGKPPSGGTGQIGKAVSGGVRGSQAIEGFSRSQLQSTRKAMVGAGMSVGEMGNLAKASTDEYKKSIIQGFTNSGQEAINGLAAGLKDSSSKIAQAAGKVGEQGVRGIKDALGIASPSKVFRQIGEFSVDGLELGFLNGLKSFKSKSIAEVRTIVALLKSEFAKIQNIGGVGGPTAGSLRQNPVGNRAYSAPIGPQPIGSATPYARGDRGQFGYSGYEPRMVSRLRGQPPAAESNSFLQFSRNAAQVQPLPGTQGSFRGFSQRATQVQQAAVGGGGVPPGGGGNAPVGGGGGGAPPRGGGGGGVFGGMQFAMPKLPGAGIVRELGTEFSFAAKQVLLFGAAYKALAFLTDFPSKVGEAVGQLQSFRNTLNAISPTAADAAASNQLILDTVDKYNIPIQSARDGFTKLYASMEPAGFSGKQIGDLFLGISKASATLGLSSDKVDRVTYAFSQMASKGQLMSEEVSGQLGDVIPGALSIMAKAANMDIKTFKKAMEDGMFVGKAFEAVMSNVPIVLEERFGKGAEGAAKTFQGALNNMQTSLTLLYQAFEPVAVGFLNAVVMPMTSGIKTLTEGLNAFFTGAATKTSGGFAIAQELEKLRPTFEGLRANAVELIKVFGALANTVLTVGKIFLQLASNPFVGYLAKITIITLSVNVALSGVVAVLGVMRGILATNAIQLLLFNRGLITGNITLSAFRARMQATGATAKVTSASIRTAGITLRTFFAATGVGLVLVGISLLIERFLTMNQALADSKEKALGAAQAIRSMSQTEARQAENQASRDIKILQKLERKGKKGDPIVKITEEEKAVLQRSGVSTGLFNPDYGKNARLFPEGPLSGLDGKSLGVEVSSLAGALQQAEGRSKEAAYRIRTVKFDEQQALTPPTLQAIPGGGGEDDKAIKRAEEKLAKSQDTLANRKQQLAIDAANQEAALDQSSFDSRLRMNDAEYDHLRALQDDHFQREMSGLDSIEARQKKFQQDLKTIENRRIDSIRKAELDSVKAVQELRSATIKAGEAPGGIVATTGGALGQDPVTRGRSSGAHLHAQAANMTENTLRYLVDKYLEIGGKTATSFGQSRGSAGHGYNAIDFLTPQNTPVKLKGGASISQYGQAGGFGGLMGQVSTPEGNFQLGHLASLTSAQGAGAASQSSSVNLNTRSGAFAMGRRNDKADNRLELEQQQATIKLSEELLRIRHANKLAIEETITLVKQNLDNIFPVREQQLENDLLRLRNDLESKGVAKEIIDMEVEKAKRTKESIYLLETYTKEIKENQDALDDYNKLKTFTTKDKLQMDFLKNRIAELNKAKVALPKAQAESNEALAEGVGLAATSSFESTMTSLKNQMKMARAFTPGQELKTQIGLDHPTATPEQQQILFDTTQSKNALEELKQKANDTASNITESLTGAFKNIVTGSMTMQEGLASSFRSIGDFFADMVMKMIADYLKLQLIEGLKNIFSMFGPAAAAAPKLGPAFAKGGIAFGGFTAFAEGGVVTGPTLGLVGEGRYNEAVIPLPDGKSVPVQLAGGTEGATAPINTNIVVNVKNGQSDSQVTGNQGNQLGREIEGAVRQVILKEIRPGGIIYGSR